MKKIAFIVLVITMCSCSKECEEQSKDLLQRYQNSVNNANGNLDAIRELQKEYNQAKSNLDC